MGVAVVVQVLQRVHTRGVQRGNTAHADNQIAGEILHRDVGDALGHAEEHRPVDLVHAHTLRQLAQMRDLGILVAVVLPALDLGLLAHHLHEQHHRDEHAHPDGHHQIEHDSQHEGEYERGNGSLRRRLAQMREVAPAGHVVGDVQQNSGDGRHGNERRIGHEESEHGDEHQRVHHAGNGRAAAGLHVGGGTRDGAGGGDAAEEHRGDVADALGHQLHVGAVMAADHGVGHHAGEQRLDGGQNGDGDAVG